MSLRLRISLLLATLTAVLLGGLGLYLDRAIGAWSAESLDAELESRSARIEHALELEHGELEIEEEHGIAGLPFRIEEADGDVLHDSSSGWPALTPPRGRTEWSETLETDRGEPIRVLSRVIRLGRARELVLRVAIPEAAVTGLGGRLRTGLAGALVLGVVAAAFGGAMLAGISLRPLRRLARDVSEIEARSLHRRVALVARDPELVALGAAFDGLLARLEASFERQRDFVARASHALRTPVAAMLTRSEVTLARRRTEAEYRSALDEIATSARESSAMVDRLLALARLEQRARELRSESVDAAALAVEMVRHQGARAELAGVSLSAGAAAPVQVRADPAALRELLEVLLDNALRYTPPGGSAGVAVEAAPPGAEIRIWDTGPGMTPEDREHAFDRFFRGSASAGKPGSGLGLSIAHAIAGLHGATIELRDRPGGGLEVVVRWPA